MSNHPSTAEAKLEGFDIEASNAANLARIRAEANITDKSDPNYNTDMDIIVPYTDKSYRELLLAGFDPTDPDDMERFVAKIEAERESRATADFEEQVKEAEVQS